VRKHYSINGWGSGFVLIMEMTSLSCFGIEARDKYGLSFGMRRDEMGFAFPEKFIDGPSATGVGTDKRAVLEVVKLSVMWDRYVRYLIRGLGTHYRFLRFGAYTICT
jgi:hypothetical protein